MFFYLKIKINKNNGEIRRKIPAYRQAGRPAPMTKTSHRRRAGSYMRYRRAFFLAGLRTALRAGLRAGFLAGLRAVLRAGFFAGLRAILRFAGAFLAAAFFFLVTIEALG